MPLSKVMVRRKDLGQGAKQIGELGRPQGQQPCWVDGSPP